MKNPLASLMDDRKTNSANKQYANTSYLLDESINDDCNATKVKIEKHSKLDFQSTLFYDVWFLIEL